MSSEVVKTELFAGTGFRLAAGTSDVVGER